MRALTSPTVLATIEQFNAVIYRVQSTILVETDLKPSQRAKLITKWIDVAQVGFSPSVVRCWSARRDVFHSGYIGKLMFYSRKRGQPYWEKETSVSGFNLSVELLKKVLDVKKLDVYKRNDFFFCV